MAAVDFRNTYELLRRVMEQQELERQGAGYGSTPSIASGSYSGGYGGPQGGLLGRLIELQEQQSRYQPSPADSLSKSRPQDPNFRQLTRVDRWPQGGTPPSDDEINSWDQGSGFDAPRTPVQGSGIAGAPGYVPAPSWMTASPGTAHRLPGRFGLPFPIPPTGLGSVTEIPKSAIPDDWKHAWTLLQLFPSLVGGLRAGQDQHGATILYNKEASPDDSNEGDDPAPPLDDPRWIEWYRRNRQRARDKENQERWAGKLNAEHDFCTQRYDKECDECKEIAKGERDLDDCKAKAAKRLGSCEKNGGPSRADLPKWRPYVEK